MRRRIAIGVALIALLIAHDAAADPCQDAPCHLNTPSNVVTEGGANLDLPPGYFLPDPLYPQLDAEVKRLQEVETRLTAENASLRKSAAEWRPGWRTLAVALAVGAAGGYYIASRW